MYSITHTHTHIYIYIWVKRGQLNVTCFIISLFNAQYVSDVNTSILRSLRLICWVISWVVLICQDRSFCISKLLRMDVLTSEICWALNNEVIKQVTASWSLFIHLIWYRSDKQKRLLPSSCPYVRVSVRPHGRTWLPLDTFSWNLILDYFRNSFQKFLFH